MTRLHLDYETASEVNLRTAGAYKYAADPSTRILMLGWAVDDGPVELWEPHIDPTPPQQLVNLMKNPAVKKHAYNAAFERLITRHCMGIEVPYPEWRCTMVQAFYLGFAGKLDQVLKAIGLEPKDARGGRLINLFCSPAPKNHREVWYDHTNRPAEWSDFRGYCLQDVNVERELHKWMSQFPAINQWDWDQWCLDQKINDRGVPMDMEMARCAINIWESEKASLTEDLIDLTGLPKVTRDPFKNWLSQAMGADIESTRKDLLEGLVRKEDTPPHVVDALTLWMQKEGKATSKYTAVLNGTGDGDRARGMFQYKGASRTDRVGGRLIQLQNLKRPIEGGSPLAIENVVSAIKTKNPGMLHMMYRHSVSDILGGSIRHVISAPEGKMFAVCDLTSIESVILGWVSMCPSIDSTFREGKDSYRMFASKYYSIPYDEVTKAQRSFSKPPVLGCGFMLGWKGLIAYSEGYGVEMSEEQAKTAVNTFRDMYPEIPAFWDWIYKAVKYVTLTGTSLTGYRMTIERDADMLRIWLPSGRALSYYKPEVQNRIAPWAEVGLTEKAGTSTLSMLRASGMSDTQLIDAGYVTASKVIDNFTYMGMNDKNQWVRISAHAGGITENIVQSLAGDVLWSGLTNADNAGLDVILHVHDEIAVEVDTVHGPEALATLEQCMTKLPHWCPDMWLGADGFLTRRYTKD